MGRMLLVACVLMVSAVAVAQPSAPLDPETEVRVSQFGDRLYHAEDCPQLSNMRSAMPVREAEAKGYAPHAACLSKLEAAARRAAVERAEKAEQDRLAAAWKECAVRVVPRFAAVKSGDLFGRPSETAAMDDLVAEAAKGSLAFVGVGADGAVLDSSGGLIALRRGELVTLEPTEAAGLRVVSLMRHNVTRGKGAFEHQSPEYVRLLIALRAEAAECTGAQKAVAALFAPATEAAVKQQLKDNPSGVLVDEVSEGMTRADVEGILGPPERKASVAGKVVYFYARMKITFVGGRVTNVE